MFKKSKNLIEDKKIECPILNKTIAEGLCYDIQMIGFGFIKPSALPEYDIDFHKESSKCENCQHLFNKK